MAMIDVSLPRRAPGCPKREKAMLLTACEDCGWEFETTNPHHRLCPTCRPVPIKHPKPVRDAGFVTKAEWDAIVAEAKSKRPLPTVEKGPFAGYGDYSGCSVTSTGMLD